MDKTPYLGTSLFLRSPDIVLVIKSRRLRWAGHLVRMEKRSDFKILTGKPAKNETFWKA